ncbi:MAG TPA: alpha/beta hydrolase [Moraxellaceae bacterium]|nr:alpha/beta hydrolase [Moraxellaceae bacterium]
MALVPVRDGQSLNVRIIGHGRSVMLLHGLGGSSAQWLPFVWPLRHAARFYLPDFRGAGASRRVGLNQSDMFQNHVEDLEDIVRHFRLTDVLLGGHSMGATTALHWLQAGGFGDVKAYLHIDQSPCVSNQPDWPHGLLGPAQSDYFSLLRELAAELDRHPPHTDVRTMPPMARYRVIDLLARAQERLGSPLPAHALRLAGRWSPLLRLLPVSRTRDLHRIVTTYLDSPDYRDSLRRCNVPVTVLVGMRSVLYSPAGQMAIAEYANECRIVPFERAGHMLPFDQPVKFLRELRRFIQR